jgi:hypothetical protein
MTPSPAQQRRIDVKTTEETSIVPIKPGARAIFIYTDKAQLGDDARQMLIEAGYVPVKVAAIDNVKLLPLTVHHEVTGDEIDLVSMVALKTLLAGKGSQTFGVDLMDAIARRRKVPRS